LPALPGAGAGLQWLKDAKGVQTSPLASRAQRKLLRSVKELQSMIGGILKRLKVPCLRLFQYALEAPLTMAASELTPLERMGDFTKAKIGFAVALLAALFTIQPLMADLKSFSLTLFGHEIPLAWFSNSVMGALTLSVYFYAWAFLSDRASSLSEKVGNFFYAVGLLGPIVYLVAAMFELGLFGMAHLKLGFVSFQWPLMIANLLMAFASGLVSFWFSRILNRKDRQSTIDALNREEDSQLGKATDTFKAGNYNFAVIQAFQAVELALQKALLQKGVDLKSYSILNLIKSSIQSELLNQEEIEKLHSIRKLRNQAAHNPHPISREEVEAALNAAGEILMRLDSDNGEPA
jgi:HEPN domain-containing protein